MKWDSIYNVLFGVFGVVTISLLSVVIYRSNNSSVDCLCSVVSDNTININSPVNSVCVGGCPSTLPVNNNDDIMMYIGDNITFNVGNNMQFVPIQSQLNNGVDYNVVIYNDSIYTGSNPKIAAKLIKLGNSFVFALNPVVSQSKSFMFMGVNSYVSQLDTTNIIDIYTVMFKSTLYPYKGGCMHIRNTNKWTCQLSVGPIICGIHYDPSFIESNWNTKIITDNGVSSSLMKNSMTEIPIQLPSSNTKKIMFTLYSNTFGVIDSNVYKRMVYIQSAVNNGNVCINSNILYFIGTSQQYICFSFVSSCTSDNKIYYKYSSFNSNDISVGFSDNSINVGLSMPLLLVECS